MSDFSSESNITTGSNSRSVSNGSIIFGIDGNSQNLITSNETRFTISKSDIIISEGLSYNLVQKPQFKKVLESTRNVSKTNIPPNRNLISKYIVDVIHG